MTEHTPGPWIVAGNNIVLKNSARTESNVIAYNVLPHNASLIAAAPELLEAAKRALDYLDRDGYENIALRAAIAKATE